MWVRLDEYAGLWEATRLQGQPFEDLLSALGPTLQHHLTVFPHLAGVIVAPAVLWNSAEPGGATHAEWRHQACVGVRSPLPGNRLRETLIVPRSGAAAAEREARQFATWYAQEETWLDWALDQMGFPSFASLIR